MNLLDDLEALIGIEFLIENESTIIEITTEARQTEQPHANKIALIQ
ncbi:TPA: hypothetical protein ACK8Z3_002880 [Legionella pneumophila]|nr:hypothetical protein [Legionella pneumophila]UAK59625.1 hypothetical protein K8P08_12115 [Legionella pneumophila]UON46250.1 hypothetical protein IUJ54_05210 [Legionella pneumophila subsp. pneumophila]WAI62738.1 hypothetical protein OXA92_06405 [Legionella pneumophila]WAI77504.1 hypothetical protein OXA91_06415 [Legionella pneumophila]CZH11442.1 Uncharacterised protein [Legionella pneumophila]